jgi:hypothetical protein
LKKGGRGGFNVSRCCFKNPPKSPFFKGGLVRSYLEAFYSQLFQPLPIMFCQ